MSKPVKAISFAARLKQFRAEAGLSIADLCKASGLPRQTIHLLERSEREPSLTTARKLAQALGRSLADFD